MRAAFGFVATLQTPWFAHSEVGSHHEPQIESRGVHDETFENVVVSPKMRSAHCPRLEQVREWTFDELTATTKESLASYTLNTSSVGVNCRAHAVCASPLSATSFRFCDVRPAAAVV